MRTMTTAAVARVLSINMAAALDRATRIRTARALGSHQGHNYRKTDVANLAILLPLLVRDNLPLEPRRGSLKRDGLHLQTA